MTKNKLTNRIRRKIIKTLRLQGVLAIDGYLTKNEAKKFSLGIFNKIEGWFSETEGIALFRISSSLPKNSTIVEIGTWKGKSTYSLAAGIDKTIKLYAIDPFDASGDKPSELIYAKTKGEKPLFEQFKNNMKTAGVFNKIKPLRGVSKDYVDKFRKIDFLFIDANHSTKACEFDFVNYSKYVSRGGYIAFHDYLYKNRSHGPTWVVERKVMKSKNWKFEGLYDFLWIGRKIN